LNLSPPTTTCAELKVLSAPLPVLSLWRCPLVPQPRRPRPESRPGSSRSQVATYSRRSGPQTRKCRISAPKRVSPGDVAERSRTRRAGPGDRGAYPPPEVVTHCHDGIRSRRPRRAAAGEAPGRAGPRAGPANQPANAAEIRRRGAHSRRWARGVRSESLAARAFVLRGARWRILLFGVIAPSPRGRHGCPGKHNRLQDRASLQPPRVMAGLVPAIHAAPLQETFKIGVVGSAWMPGTRPGMTVLGCCLSAYGT
jgi:hypothetical protein